MLTTRRDVLRFAAGLPVAWAALPAWAFASKEFWEAKPASEWSADEIDRMLTKSPWAKDASVMSGSPGFGNRGSGRTRGGGIGFPGGGGGIGFPGGGVGFPGGGRQGCGYPGGGNDGGGRERLMATVRWESALPIQEALRIGASDEKPNADFDKYYVIALIGDLSASGRRRSSTSDDDDDSTTRADRRLEELKESARLERKDGPISLEKVEEGSRVGSRGPGVYFYFDRKADVSMDDKFVNFSTKLGRMEIKAKFTMKEMSYHGKLAV